MERAPFKSKDNDNNRVFDFIFQNAMGNPIVFDATPTLATMKANTWGYYGTNLYIKFADNTGLVIS